MDDILYKEIISAFGSLRRTFQPVLPFLVASLAYHKDFLVQNLLPTHPLLLTRLWGSNLLDRMKSRVLAGCGENATSQMIASGVSPTLVLANQLDQLTNKVNELMITAEVQKEELLASWKSDFKALPDLVSAHIRETLEINRAISVTQSDVLRIVTNAFESYAAAMHQRQPVAPVEALVPAENRINRPHNGGFFESRWRLYTWTNDSQQYFPEDFVFPSSMNVSTLWDKWYFSGDQEQAPYRKLSSVHVSSGGKSIAVQRTQKGYLSKAKGIMDELAKILRDSGSIAKSSDLFTVSYEDSRVHFNMSFMVFVKKVYGVEEEIQFDNMRIGEIKYNTLYENWRRLTTKKRKKVTANDGSDNSDDDVFV